MKDNGDGNRLQRLEALYEAVCNWAGEREVHHPSDGALLKALWAFDGDYYTGPCPGCDAECDEPCAQACTVAEAHARIDAEMLSRERAIRDEQQAREGLHTAARTALLALQDDEAGEGMRRLAAVLLRGALPSATRQRRRAADADPQLQPLLAARDVLAERLRQFDVEGWTPEHDDQYTEGELAVAAACYAVSSIDPDDVAKEPPRLWPLPAQWWKPSTAERMLEQAGGLLLAEMERRRRRRRRTRLAPIDSDEERP
ncbi:hypothetical protein [Azohydromonas australica]|uniref:hypothetical protein n=1 Tax=Azohydromonas australica TaxID=364039 RepID=UPI0003FD30DD|nr:hypothetical protein [Azohydromonas australica]